MTPDFHGPGDSSLGPSFPERFSYWAGQCPDRPAVQDDTRCLTYAALDLCSAAFAAALRGLGLGRSTTPAHYDINAPEKARVSPWVLVHTRRNPNVMLGILSVLRAGGAYISIPSDAPVSYVRQIMDRARVSAVLTDTPQVFADTGVPCFCLDDPPPDPDSDMRRRSQRLIPDPEDMAVAIFTSGSTGMPKGAVLEHRALSEMLAWQQVAMDLSPGSHTAAFAPFGFIAAIWELFFPLASGMTLHILSEDLRRDPPAMDAYFDRHAVRYVFFSPEMLALYSQSCAGRSLRYVRVAGGPLRSCAQTPFEILYSLGMSENGGSVTFSSLHGPVGGTIPLGKAFGRTRVYLLGEDHRPVPLGEKGLMAVASPSLARGYLGMAQKNADCFIPNPFQETGPAKGSPGVNKSSKADYSRLFISGDLARLDGEGNLVHCGRKDFVVKIRGMQVNPGHVEAVLARCPGVGECLVLGLTDPGGGDCLVAWAAGHGLDKVTIRKALCDSLPPYMVPARIRIMNRLPRGVNGKIDRACLREQALAPEAGLGLEPATTETLPGPRPDARLKKVCDLFAQVLGQPRIKASDHFFSLGGDSLKLARLQLLLRRDFGADLSYRHLFDHPTPQETLAVLDRLGQPRAVQPIPRETARSSYPLSEPMRQMYLLWRLGTTPRAYEVDICLHIQGQADRDQLAAAFQDLVAGEPVLRAVFSDGNPDPEWTVSARVGASPVLLKARDLEGARALWHRVNAERPSLNLNQAPLFFAAIIDAGTSGLVLGFATHHILADAAGLRRIADLWWQHYADRTGQGTAFGAPDAVSMTDVVLWQEHPSLGQDRERADAYWQSVFSTPVPPLNLAGAVLPRPFRLAAGTATVRAAFSSNDRESLYGLARAHGLTVFQIILAVWAAFLSRMSARSAGFDPVVVGVPFAGRNHPDLLDCIGMFVRTLPLRFSPAPDGNVPFSAWFEAVRESFMDAWDHQASSLERIVGQVQAQRLPGRNPLFDVMINWVPAPRPFRILEGENSPLSARILPGVTRPALFDLVLEIREADMALELTYAQDLFAPGLAETWVRALAQVCGAAARDPGLTLATAPWPASEALFQTRVTVPDAAAFPAWSNDLPFAADLIRAWKEVLAVEDAAPGHDFFDCGGDSIKAMRLEALMYASGWFLPATEIYRQAKLGALAEAVTPVDEWDEGEDEFD